MQAHKLKKVALRLAALERRDRRWILQRLPVETRKPIKRHVKALLGIVGRDMALMADISSSLVATAPKRSEDAVTAAKLKPLPDPAMERMVSVLEEAPSSWVAAVLKTQPAGVRDTYIEACDEAKQAELTTALARAPEKLPPRLAEAIRICLEDIGSTETKIRRQPSFEELLHSDKPVTDGVAA